jgi:uncharacterized protein DUF6491
VFGIRNLMVILLGAAVSGCGIVTTTTRTVDNYEVEVVATEVGEGNCFTVESMGDVIAIDDHHVYFSDESNDTHYLVTTKAMCRGLIVAPVIEIPNTSGRICQNGSRIAYRWTPPRTTCGIDNIEVVANKEAAFALYDSRTTVEKVPLFDLIFFWTADDSEETDAND